MSPPFLYIVSLASDKFDAYWSNVLASSASATSSASVAELFRFINVSGLPPIFLARGADRRIDDNNDDDGDNNDDVNVDKRDKKKASDKQTLFKTFVYGQLI